MGKATVIFVANVIVVLLIGLTEASRRENGHENLGTDGSLVQEPEIYAS
jgi:hypothetical protein